MTPTEYRAALARLGLTQIGAGNLLGVSPRTAQDYALKGPTPTAARLICAYEIMTDEQRALVWPALKP